MTPQQPRSGVRPNVSQQAQQSAEQQGQGQAADCDPVEELKAAIKAAADQAKKDKAIDDQRVKSYSDLESSLKSFRTDGASLRKNWNLAKQGIAAKLHCAVQNLGSSLREVKEAAAKIDTTLTELVESIDSSVEQIVGSLDQALATAKELTVAAQGNFNAVLFAGLQAALAKALKWYDLADPNQSPATAWVYLTEARDLLAYLGQSTATGSPTEFKFPELESEYAKLLVDKWELHRAAIKAEIAALIALDDENAKLRLNRESLTKLRQSRLADMLKAVGDVPVYTATRDDDADVAAMAAVSG